MLLDVCETRHFGTDRGRFYKTVAARLQDERVACLPAPLRGMKRPERRLTELVQLPIR